MTSALALTLLLAGPTSAKEIQWEKNFDKAMKKAEERNMPVMIDFWAEWCGFCHRLDRTTYVDPEVTGKAQNFVAVKINTEGSRREREVVERYKVHSLPTILFVSPGGLQVWRVNSFVGPGRFPFIMDEALEAAQRVHAWEDELARNPNDAGALASIGHHLFQQECYEQSGEYLGHAAHFDSARPVDERRTTRLLLAILQNVKRQFAQAESLLKEALTLNPEGEDQPKLLFFLGRTYVSWGRHEMGVATMQVIVREHPRSPIAQRAQETLVTLERK